MAAEVARYGRFAVWEHGDPAQLQYSVIEYDAERGPILKRGPYRDRSTGLAVAQALRTADREAAA